METLKNKIYAGRLWTVIPSEKLPEFAVGIIVFLLFVCHYTMNSFGHMHLHLEVKCTKGYYLYRYETNEHCFPCPSGTFLSEIQHRRSECKLCRQPLPCHHEKTLRMCTPDSDTVIGCDKGYFRSNNKDGKCVRCSSCRRGYHIAKPCDSTGDTVCCPMPGMTVIAENSGKVQCVFQRSEIIEVTSSSNDVFMMDRRILRREKLRLKHLRKV
ncbi:tumor necrosis factor receptor superfamily member 26 [Biomphalaria glabrata]|nr:tumor necrosis factor receptor superfamily member 26 [Biomphalaria glabrata]